VGFKLGFGGPIGLAEGISPEGKRCGKGVASKAGGMSDNNRVSLGSITF